MALTAQEKKELAALEAELKPKPSGLSAAERKEMLALEAELYPKSSGPKKEIKREEPKLSFMEKAAGVAEQVGKNFQQSAATNPTLAPLIAAKKVSDIGANVSDRLSSPIFAVANEIRNNPSQVINNTDPVALARNLGRVAVDTARSGKHVDLQLAQADPNSGFLPHAVAKGLNMVGSMALDPTNVLLAGKAGKFVDIAVKDALLEAKTAAALSPLGKRVSARAQRISETPSAQPVIGFLGAIGKGPVNTMRKAAFGQYGVELETHYREVNQVVDSIDRELLRIQKRFPDANQRIMNYGATHEKASPLNETIRDYVIDKLKNSKNQLPSPSNPNLPATITPLQNFANFYGLDWKFIETQGDEIIRQLQRTEGTLQKFKPQKAQHITPERWLTEMFGKEPVQRLGQPGATLRAGTGIKEIREAGLRTVVDKLSQGSKYVEDIPTNPNWVQVPDRPGFEQLAGKYVPPQLLQFINHEALQAGLRATEDAKSSYIWANDIAQWYAKHAVGGFKKGFLSQIPTIAANTLSNTIQANGYLKRFGVGPITLPELKAAMAERWKFRRTGELGVASKTLSEHTNALSNTLASTSTMEGAGKFGQVHDVRYSGMPGAFHVPSLQDIWHRNPVNQLTELHGMIEEAYKVAMFKKLEGKLGPMGAAKQVEKALFDYGDKGDLLQWADKFGLWIFNTFPTKAFDQFMDIVVSQPSELLRYKRLRELAVGEDDPMKNKNLPDYLRRSPSTIPLGDNQYTNVSRFLPLGGVVDQLAGYGQGTSLKQEASNIAEKNIAGPAGWIGAGYQPYASDTGLHQPLMQEGQPPKEEIGLQLKLARSYLPSYTGLGLGQAGGRAAQAWQEVVKGIGTYDTTKPKGVGDWIAQYVLGLRGSESDTPIDKWVEGKVRGAGKIGPAASAYGQFLASALQKPTPPTISSSYPKLDVVGDPKGYLFEMNKLNKYINKLFQSSRVVNSKGEVVDPERLENAAQTFAFFVKRAGGKE